MSNKIVKSIICFIVFLGSLLVGVNSFAQEEQHTDFIFKGKLVTGKITEIKTSENLITVNSNSGEVIEFVFSEGETVIWIDDDEKSIEDLKPDMEAELKYTENEREQKVLSWIDIVINEEIAPVVESDGENEKETVASDKAEGLTEEVASSVVDVEGVTDKKIASDSGDSEKTVENPESKIQ